MSDNDGSSTAPLVDRHAAFMNRFGRNLSKCSGSCGGKVVFENHARFPLWCLKFKCSICLKTWNVCRVCGPAGTQTTRMLSRESLIQHSNLHMAPTESKVQLENCLPCKRKVQLENHLPCKQKANEAINLEDRSAQDVQVELKRHFRDNFLHEMFIKHHINNKGKNYLSAVQMTGTPNPGAVSDLDADINVLFASLLIRITKGERMLLAKIMSKVVEKIIHDHSNDSEGVSGNIKTPVPSSENDLRRYLDGRHAILNNVPIPNIHVLPNGDCYVLPSDFLRLFFSLGVVKPDMIKTMDEVTTSIGGVCKIWETKKAKECFHKLRNPDDSSFKLLLCEWSDSFDPNSTNKNNRGSIHVTTFSLFCADNRNDKELSFLSTISSDTSDLKEVRKAVYNDIKALEEPTMFFDGKEFISVQVIPFVTIQDRPERSKSTGCGYHNGKYNGRWGWSSVVDKKLVPCNQCHKARLKEVVPVPRWGCRLCYDWNSSMVTFSLPVPFPLDRKTTSSKQITFATMRAAVETAYKKLHNDSASRWNAASVRNFLKVEGLNESLIREVLDCESEDELQNVIPPVWSHNTELSSHIDTIMHLCFLGVTQTTGMLLKDVFVKYNKYTTFHNHNHQLKTIRYLQLDWCKCWVFGSVWSPFGPWVSENSLAYARIFKHMYGPLQDIPNENVRTLAKLLVQALVAMLARIMQESVDNSLIVSVDRHVKLFLTIFCQLELELHKDQERKKLKIETTSNLMGLLNLSSYMEDYGPLRIYWEGGCKGEGLLKYIKPMVNQGTHKTNFSQNLMNRYYKDRFLQNILDIDIKEEEEAQGDEQECNIRYGKFRTYSTDDEVLESLKKGEALSVLLHEGGDIWVSMYVENNHAIGVILANDDDGKFIDGTYTTTLKLEKMRPIDLKELLNDSVVSMFGLALPLCTDTDGDYRYYIINSTWEERQWDKKTILQHLYFLE